MNLFVRLSSGLSTPMHGLQAKLVENWTVCSLNLVPVCHGFCVARPALILRSDMHLPGDLPDMSKPIKRSITVGLSRKRSRLSRP